MYILGPSLCRWLCLVPHAMAEIRQGRKQNKLNLIRPQLKFGLRLRKTYGTSSEPLLRFLALISDDNETPFPLAAS